MIADLSSAYSFLRIWVPARVASGTFFLENGLVEVIPFRMGQTLCVGGKTGTGDNRLRVYGSRGALMGSIGVIRTSAFVFFIGDRFFGTVVADVPGAHVGGYHFTSALPLQVFRPLVPKIRPLL